MIRNIPNKYNYDMMLSSIDQEFKDTYDFFYLPIDFKVITVIEYRTNATWDMHS